MTHLGTILETYWKRAYTAKAIKKTAKDMSELMQGHMGDKAELMHSKYMELVRDPTNSMVISSYRLFAV